MAKKTQKSAISVPRPGRIFGHSSLHRTLLLWFLLLSLLPLTIVSLIAYWNTQQTLFEMKHGDLEVIAHLKSRQIRSYFNSALTDLRLQSESIANTRYLEVLTKAFVESGKPLNEFVGSYRWALIIAEFSADLKTLQRTYGYHDIFLIDASGNILFSVIKETDLGTNLFDGEYSGTLLAKACRETLESGRQTFSDLEFYAPSNNIIAGFLTDVIVDDNGDKIGLIAFQVRIEPINAIMQDREGLSKTGETYLVGVDGFLRSDYHVNVKHGTLKKQVETEQVQLWQEEHGVQQKMTNDIEESAFIYAGPHDGRRVLGVHNAINIAGVKWGMIAEIEEIEAFAPARRLGILALTLLVVTVLIVALLAIPITNRIIRPVRELTRISKLAARGDLDQKVKIAARNEIGELAESFNLMLKYRWKAEKKLAKRKLQLEQLNIDLVARNKDLDEFTYIASHDLQEPLRKLSSFCSLLEKDIG